MPISFIEVFGPPYSLLMVSWARVVDVHSQAANLLTLILQTLTDLSLEH